MNKRRAIKTLILVFAVAGVGVVLMAWNPQPANAPQSTATENNNAAPSEKTDEELQQENVSVPEMAVLRESQSQLLFGGRLNVTLQRLESTPCTPLPADVNAPAGSNPCASLPVNATLTVADNTDTTADAQTISLVFPSLGSVQTFGGYFYQFVDLSGEGNDRSARFLVRSLQPLTPPLPTQAPQDQGTTITIPAQ